LNEIGRGLFRLSGMPVFGKPSLLQVVELQRDGDWLKVDRDALTRIALRPEWRRLDQGWRNLPFRLLRLVRHASHAAGRPRYAGQAQGAVLERQSGRIACAGAEAYAALCREPRALHLPASLPEGQVRSALHAVHKAIWSDPGNFTADGFLTIGFAGHQPELADWYSNNGSMYIASESFLALGLPAADSYWTAAALDWTQKKAFANRKFPKDYPVTY
jgi:hypothetical protein